MKLHIGVFESSRKGDIEGLFSKYYPDSQIISVKSRLHLRQVDVVLAGGGPDLNPEHYGQEDRACHHVNKARDARDLDLMHAVLDAGLPFLGLCRGAQLLNIALNGTLYQDLGSDRGIIHSPVHTVECSGIGADHLGTTAQVNSTHHQGVDHLGDGLQVIGSAADGLPEAWYRPGAIGTQFHPESLVHDDPRWLRLFDWWLGGAA